MKKIILGLAMISSISTFAQSVHRLDEKNIESISMTKASEASCRVYNFEEGYVGVYSTVKVQLSTGITINFERQEGRNYSDCKAAAQMGINSSLAKELMTQLAVIKNGEIFLIGPDDSIKCAKYVGYVVQDENASSFEKKLVATSCPK